MHEIKAVEDLFRILLDVASENRLCRIDKVNVVIGEYLQVKPSLFRFAFDSAKDGTIASGAVLDIYVDRIEFNCRYCKVNFLPEGIRYRCPFCGSSEAEIVKGREIFIKSIEGE